MMAAGLAAQRLGAESPLHFGVAPQSTAQCPSPPSRPVSFRVTARQSRFVRPRCASRSVRCSLHPIGPRHRQHPDRALQGGCSSSRPRRSRRASKSTSRRPCPWDAPSPAAAHMRVGRQVRAWPSRVLRWRQQCHGGEASAQERRTRMLRSVRDPLVAATADVQRADCALKSGR